MQRRQRLSAHTPSGSNASWSSANTAVDYVTQQLAAVRATPVAWVAGTQLNCPPPHGWARDWGVTIAYRTTRSRISP